MTSAQQIQQMYIAFYGRPADPAGLAWWVAQAEEKGMDWVQDAFGYSDEFDQLQGSKSRSQLVNDWFQQAFGRDATQSEVNSFNQQLNTGGSRGDLLKQLLAQAENSPADQQALNNRTQVAEQFTKRIEETSTSFTAAEISAAAQLLRAVNVNSTGTEIAELIQNLANSIQPGRQLIEALKELNSTNDTEDKDEVTPTFDVKENQGTLTISGDAKDYVVVNLSENTITRSGNLITLEGAPDITSVNAMAYEGSVSVLGTLDEILNATLQGVADYSLTNSTGDIGGLTVTQAKVLEGATNAGEYSYVVTSSFADANGVVFTNASSVNLNSSGGSQIIVGSSGDDTFNVDFGAGHAANLNISGGDGTDVLSFWNGAGNVTLNDGHFANISNMEVLSLASAGAGTNTATLGANASAAFAGGITVNVEQEDILILNGSTLTVSMTVNGGNGGNTITGSNQADVISVGSGTNFITGGKGKDTINLAADAGTDTIVINGGDSTSTAYDSITNFQIDGTDKLQLGYGQAVWDVAVDAIDAIDAIDSLSHGIVSFSAGITSLNAKFDAIFQAMDANQVTAAFVHGDNTYVVQNDGVAGTQASDIVVELVGVSVTDLGAILTAAP